MSNENRPNINSMYAQAWDTLSDYGIADERHPDQVELMVLATHDPKDVHGAITSGYVAGIHTGYRTPSTEDARGKQRAERIDQVSENLSRRARRLVQIGVAAAAIGVGSWFLIAKGEVDAEFKNAHPPTPTLMAGNTLTYDPSILPGDDGKHWPVIGPILRNIPACLTINHGK